MERSLVFYARSSGGQEAPMRMQDVRSGSTQSDLRAVILTADKFEDMELFVPYFRLLDEGVAVDIAAPSMDEIGGEHGYSILPDLLIDDVDPDDYDLLLIPGRFPDGAPAVVRGIEHAQAIARSFFAASRPVAAICHGPWLLVSADGARSIADFLLARRGARRDQGSGRRLERRGGRRGREPGDVALAGGYPGVHGRHDANDPSALKGCLVVALPRGLTHHVRYERKEVVHLA